MSLALQNAKNLCSRSDGHLTVEVVNACFFDLVDKPVYCVLGVVVPYSIESSKKRKRNHSKKLSELSAVTVGINKTEISSNATWNEPFKIHIKNLTTMNFLQVECWTPGTFKSTFIGYTHIPLSNSFTKRTKGEFPIVRNGKTMPVGEIHLKLLLEPAAPGYETIAMYKENIKSIPDFIFRSFWLPRLLQKLVIQECKLTEIPKEITTLSKLTILNVSKNQLTEIPEFISTLSTLREADFSSNQIYAIPDFFATAFPKLTMLCVYDNPLVNISDAVKNLGNVLKTDMGNQGNPRFSRIQSCMPVIDKPNATSTLTTESKKRYSS